MRSLRAEMQSEQRDTSRSAAQGAEAGEEGSGSAPTLKVNSLEAAVELIAKPHLDKARDIQRRRRQQPFELKPVPEHQEHLAAGAPGGKMPWINSIAADNRERQDLRERPPRAKCGLDSEQTEGFVRSAEAAAAEAAQDARDAAAAEVAGVAAEWRAARRQAPEDAGVPSASKKKRGKRKKRVQKGAQAEANATAARLARGKHGCELGGKHRGRRARFGGSDAANAANAAGVS